MVLNEYRKNAEPYLLKASRPFINSHPNTLTWIAFFWAVVAGFFFVLTWYFDEFLFAASGAIFANAIFDALDGKVARLTGKVSKRGDFLDHVLDRYADVFIIGGIMLSPYVVRSIYCKNDLGIFISLLAILGIIFASYMGTQAQAVGCKRNYGGILGRADRLVILIFAPGFQYLFVYFGIDLYLTFLEWVLVLFAILGNITAIQRIMQTWEELGKIDEMDSNKKEEKKK
ncbi:MAG: CDP-alcohol phosphatidyltransferase family protein [Thermoplasmata archaeon]